MEAEEKEKEKDKSTPQSQLKLLIAKGKEQGYLTYHEVNDHLPSDIVDPEQIEDIVNMINDMGIQVFETAPDQDTLMMTEGNTDEDAAEAAAQALTTPEQSAISQINRCACQPAPARRERSRPGVARSRG